MREKIKLLYIANERIPTDRANGLQIMKTCEAMAKNGVELELVIPRRKTEAMNEDPFDYYKVERVFKLKKLACLDLIPYLYFLGPIPYWLISVTFSLSAAFHSMTHSHDFLYFRHDSILFWFFIFCKKKLISEFHFLAEKKYQRFFPRLKLAVAINRSAKEIYQSIKGMKDKVVWAPDGVSIEDFALSITKEDARRKLGLAVKGRYVVYTGHFYSWKGIDTLIKAAALLPKDITVLLVGGGTPEDSTLLKEKLPENIILIGQKKYSEIPFYLKAADCLVITGTAKDEHSNYFTSPLKLFEYMASGRPIVASGTSAIQEVLVHKKNSWLVQPDDERALADGIAYIFENPSTAKLLVEEAKRDVENYTWEKRAKKIISSITTEVRLP
ncbi:MAG: hypothetical protein A3G49_04945 [Candidatus Sungbacteria bacterium RIFCSPLOWO2_12_FULL_41_11]|uniref:Glycosyl transferase family 1 domain-containing protein n=1 Tax=Candidatus Sungbacteria bacterium RIFCSPLOWO2_12_FULL_41_11 TaxID=1802286 RepID=A0A1G2LSF1_9BACT|nr:MAG: Glycosyl transferase group 1 [Parcubacteria group bacterium GW2011_GWA2_42_14]OGZ98087.1 MAG: hypothetical protein A3D41_03130 [Candidatus Sungbacteria bacterium RIFCSPHIGHO2_02_FULL_41_12b]OHA13721.1 MAG: hypothetical protein A3G49_04945 [Candidatus Sungbacteria bacterium RIFCSPLOWO2_12_FULL_41_11]